MSRPVEAAAADRPGQSRPATTGQPSANAIESIVERFGPTLWRLAGSFELDSGLREDLVQDMLVAIWRALPRLDDPERLTAYVLRIARNRAVSHVARQAGRPERVHQPVEPGDAGAGPYDRAEQSDRQQRLLAAVRSLPIGQREVITLFLEGLSHAEIADILEITENNVAVRINRARARLTERLSA
jgi:RNA polymerase sigma-70 factor (ECF subfamily)